MIDFIGLGILLLLVLLFAYLAYRALRTKRGAAVKWVGFVLSGLLTLLLGAVLVVALMGTSKLAANYNASHPVANVKVAGTPEQVARGERIAHGCAGCHGTNGQLPLSGQNFGEGFPFPIGTLYARNLTPGGELKDWSDGEVLRALREGVHKSGRSLVIMPSKAFHNFGDEDAQAIVAYLRSQAAVTPDAPPNNVNVIAALLIATMGEGILSVQPPIAGPVVAPPEGVSAAYGEYLTKVIGCRDCHGENLQGGAVGGGPDAGAAVPSLSGVKNWSEADFVKTIRTGTLPTGEMLKEGMPWKDISAATTDDNLKAIYQYLKTIP